MSLWHRLVHHRKPLAPLSTTRMELDATRAHHLDTLSKADRVLEDYRKFDVAVRVSVVRK